MKIGLLSENYYPTLGGIQEHMYHLARQLATRGHQVRVLTGLPKVARWRGPPDTDRVIRLGAARSYCVMGTVATMTFGPAVALRLWKTLRRERFDLIHVHGPCDMGLPMCLYPLFGGPIVATLHSPINDPSPIRRLAAPYYRWVLNRARAVISVSEAAKIAMGRYARFEAQVIPNGVDVPALAAGRPLPRFADGATNILMLGRLEPRNGPDIMFQALPHISRARPDVRLLVAGEGRNGTKDHEAMVPAAVRDRVVFLGPVYEERPDVYASARLCVLPARSGTFSIIALEALAAGIPVVATPFVHGYQNERHFQPIVVTPDFEPVTFANAVIAALAENPAARIERGRAIAAELDWSRVVERIERTYIEAAGSR